MKKDRIAHNAYTTNEQVITALQESKGVISETAKMLGLKSPCALRDRIKKTPELNAVLIEERMKLVDLAKDGLAFYLEKKHPWAIKFVLKSVVASHEGFGEQQNIKLDGEVQNTNIDVNKLNNLTLEEKLTLERTIKHISADSTES